MTSTIEQVTNLEASWPDLWPLRQAALEHHRAVDRWEQPNHSKESVLEWHRRWFEDGPSLYLVAREEGQAIGTGNARIRAGGWSEDETVGYLSAFFILPQRRGTALVFRMHDLIEDWLREQSISDAERDTVATNFRTVALWGHLGFLPYTATLRSRAEAETGHASVTRQDIKVRVGREIGGSWNLIWPLLRLWRDG